MRIFKTMAMRIEDLSMLTGVGMARVALSLLLSISLLLRMVAAQPGFISIDCGSTINYTDSSTGVLWTTDEGYISSSLGMNQPVTALLQSDNAQQITTARYFKPGRNKNCYALPVAVNNSYLIRATFLYGDLDNSPPSNYGFNLSIDSTFVASVSISPSEVNTAVDYEFFVASTGNQINFCVIPVVGNAFISSLELRPLTPTMYRGLMFGSKYTKTLYRLNTGAASSDPTVRFPDDLYDRLWKSPTSDYTISSISTTTSLGTIPSVIFDNPPMKVMQTAWSDLSFWFNWPFHQETTTVFYVTLYFVEIGTPKPTDRRSIDIFLNDALWFRAYNVVKTVDEVFDAEDSITLGTANFSLNRDPLSTLNPLLNGVELHAIYDTITITTLSTDASALLSVQQNLNLLDWTGDPCLPVSWDWVNCSNAVPPRVTQLKLSSYQLNGTIPASLADLTALTDLWLDNNFISGAIPDLSRLYLLRTLHLQNNSLTGPVPDSLAQIPNLSELFIEGNMLTGPVPAALLNKSGLYIIADNSSNSNSASGGKKLSSSGAVIGAAVGSVVVVAIALLVICLCFQRKKAAKTQPQPEITGSHTGASKFSSHSDPSYKAGVVGHGSHIVQTTRWFSKAEVLGATDNFSRKIGEGGFGPVYYGQLQNREEVAVKVNSAESGQGSVEFSTEVSLLSRVHHRNLVSLVGFCDEDDQQILIYEYMQNGTLREHLYGRGLTQTLDWQTRLDIAVNAARGLEYLHYDCSPKIIHRDVKSNNILLNEKLLAKVADFGISKLAPDEDTTASVSTAVRGTTGYLDPEYFSTNKLTQKSDVYAFGVVLLEMIAGRAPNNNKLSDALQWNLVEYARGMLRDGNLEGLVDRSLEGTYNVEAMWKLAELSMYCVEPHAVNRPDMRQVVRELMEAVDLEHPRDSPPSTADVMGGFTAILEDNTQTSYPSYPSTQSSIPDASPSPGTRKSAASFTSLDSWKQPQAR